MAESTSSSKVSMSRAIARARYTSGFNPLVNRAKRDSSSTLRILAMVRNSEANLDAEPVYLSMTSLRRNAL
jgi:hypothetical protein